MAAAAEMECSDLVAVELRGAGPAAPLPTQNTPNIELGGRITQVSSYILLTIDCEVTEPPGKVGFAIVLFITTTATPARARLVCLASLN